MAIPSTSRRPSLLTPTAMVTATEKIRFSVLQEGYSTARLRTDVTAIARSDHGALAIGRDLEFDIETTFHYDLTLDWFSSR